MMQRGAVLSCLFFIVFLFLYEIFKSSFLKKGDEMKTLNNTIFFCAFMVLAQVRPAVDYNGTIATKKGQIVLTSTSIYNGGLLQSVTTPSIDWYPDPLFNGVGSTFFSIGNGGDDEVFALELQPDGKIVMAGYSLDNNGYYYSLARLLSSGMLDVSFGIDGKVIVSEIGSALQDIARSVAILSNGNIVAAGYSAVGNTPRYSAVQLLPNGQLDPAFGNGGKVLLRPIGTNNRDVSRGLVIQSDGKLVLAGYSTDAGIRKYSAVRLLSDGSLDVTFGTGGTVLVTPIGNGGNDLCFSLALQPDGKLVLAGFSLNGIQNFYSVVRLLPDGTLDTSFGIGGKVLLTGIGNAGNDRVNAVKIQSDGKIVLAGFSVNGIQTLCSAARLLPNGTLDTSFGNNGTVLLPAIGNSNNDVATCLEIQSNGNIVLGGYSQMIGVRQFRYLAVCLLPDGTLDNTFGSNGIFLFPSLGDNGNASAYASGLQSDGKIVFGGYTVNNNMYCYSAARLTDTFTLSDYQSQYPASGGLY